MLGFFHLIGVQCFIGCYCVCSHWLMTNLLIKGSLYYWQYKIYKFQTNRFLIWEQILLSSAEKPIVPLINSGNDLSERHIKSMFCYILVVIMLHLPQKWDIVRVGGKVITTKIILYKKSLIYIERNVSCEDSLIIDF